MNPENPVLLSKKLVSSWKAIPGFSLVEVVIALGIVSFAVVAILGMLPVALKTARNSMFETDATLAAQRLISELQTGTGANRTVSYGTNGVPITLSANSTHILAFSNSVPVFSTTSLDANPTVEFFAQILVSTNTGFSNLSQVQVNISHPATATATATNRTTNSFTTLIGF